MLPTIYIDADACPVTAEALAVARKNNVPVVIAGNSTQNLARHIRRGDPRKPQSGFWVDTLAVGVGADAADFAIVQELEPGDIVVMAGIDEVTIGDTICTRDAPTALPRIRVDEPTVAMRFGINTSPLAGREGKMPFWSRGGANSKWPSSWRPCGARGLNSPWAAPR